jgi:hypothetical protein
MNKMFKEKFPNWYKAATYLVMSRIFLQCVTACGKTRMQNVETEATRTELSADWLNDQRVEDLPYIQQVPCCLEIN